MNELLLFDLDFFRIGIFNRDCNMSLSVNISILGILHNKRKIFLRFTENADSVILNGDYQFPLCVNESKFITILYHSPGRLVVRSKETNMVILDRKSVV